MNEHTSWLTVELADAERRGDRSRRARREQADRAPRGGDRARCWRRRVRPRRRFGRVPRPRPTAWCRRRTSKPARYAPKRCPMPSGIASERRPPRWQRSKPRRRTAVSSSPTHKRCVSACSPISLDGVTPVVRRSRISRKVAIVCSVRTRSCAAHSSRPSTSCDRGARGACDRRRGAGGRAVTTSPGRRRDRGHPHPHAARARTGSRSRMPRSSSWSNRWSSTTSSSRRSSRSRSSRRSPTRSLKRVR